MHPDVPILLHRSWGLYSVFYSSVVYFIPECLFNNLIEQYESKSKDNPVFYYVFRITPHNKGSYRRGWIEVKDPSVINNHVKAQSSLYEVNSVNLYTLASKWCINFLTLCLCQSPLFAISRVIFYRHKSRRVNRSLKWNIYSLWLYELSTVSTM